MPPGVTWRRLAWAGYDAHWILEALQRGKPLAVAVPASTDERKAWIDVYPLDPAHRSTRIRLARVGIVPLGTTRIYQVRKFEIENALLDEWFGDEALLAKSEALAFGEEDLERLLAFGVALEQLDHLFKCDCPL